MRKALVLCFVMAGSAMADLIVTVNPDTSGTYPVGTTREPGEVAETADPLGPFTGSPVYFEGWESGGSTVTITGTGTCATEACLVFSYNLAFSTPTTIGSISLSEDGSVGGTLQLLNSSDVVIDSVAEGAGNTGSPTTYTMPTPDALGTSFTLDLYDSSTHWVYVSDISVSTTPEPMSWVLLATAFVVVGFARRGARNCKLRTT